MTISNKSAMWMTSAGVLGLALGTAVTYLVMERGISRSAASPRATATPTASTGTAEIVVTPEAAARAGIKIGTASSADVSSDLRVPGHVEANGYKQVSVAATTSGRVTSIRPELGTVVKRGQVLAQLFAPEVADQQRVYLSMRAELETAHAKLLRTEGLVKLGSVSQQELEAVRTDHTTHATDVEGARARLLLLGVSAETLDKLTTAADIVSTANVVSPIDGTVTARNANVGQNIQTGAELFRIADLSQVWVVADVFERDLLRVGVGSRILVFNPMRPGAAWPSTVTYLDPQVVPETRTVRLRADVNNPGGLLKLGQYVDVAVQGSTAKAVVVPRAAVQTIADRQFVYVPDPAASDRFLEREVQTGTATDKTIEIVSGLAAGDRVVVEGSFFLRAERDRLGLPLPHKH